MVGETLQHYEILGKLGEGGMGDVYVARDTRLGRKVAFKTLPPMKAADARLRERFAHEARLVASLNHPNIVTVYSVEEAQGLRFLTMELVEGETLARKVPPKGLEAGEFFALALPLCEAVAAAHEHGIVHRDLKPGNVMVTREGRLKVLDFGLATLITPTEDEAPAGEAGELARTATEVGTVSGTIPYMSPEQLSNGAVGAKSDLFSLGVLFFEMLTGARPFDGSSAVAVMAAILRDPPPSPAERRSAEGGSPVPPALERIVLRCLEKRPENRPRDARELYEELKRAELAWRTGDSSPDPSVVFEPAGASRPPGRWVRAALPLGVAALTALLVFGLFSLVRSAIVPAPPDGAAGGAETGPARAAKKRIVILPFENLGPPQEEYFAAGVTEEITSRLATVSGLAVISRASAVHYTGSGKGTREIGEELGVDYILEGTVRWEGADAGLSRVRVTPQLIRVADDTHVWSERYDQVLEDLFEVQSKIAEQVIRELDVALFPREREALRARPTESIAAYESYLRGLDYSRRLNYSAANGEKALEALRRAVELDPGFALAWATTSQVHSLFYHFGHDRSDERAELAKRAVDRAFELAPGVPEVRIAFGNYLYWVLRDYDGALAQFDVAEESLPGNSEILESRAFIERRQGRWEEARAHLEEALELNPRDDRTARELGGTLFFLRRYEEADRYYDRAISFSPDPLSAYQSKARARWRAGDLEASRAALEAMPRVPGDPLSVWFWFWQEVYEERYGAALERLGAAPDEVIQWTVVHLPVSLLEAWAHDFQGEAELARRAYETSRAFLEKAVGDDPSDARLRDALGHAYAGLGRKAEALACGEKAIELYPISSDAVFGAYHRIELALILAGVGELDAAVDEIEHLLSIPSQLSVAHLRLDPRWRPLRDHPRFQKLLASADRSAARG